MPNSRDNNSMTEIKGTKGRIVISYFPDAEDDMDVQAQEPEFVMSAQSVDDAEEVLGKLERFIDRNKK